MTFISPVKKTEAKEFVKPQVLIIDKVHIVVEYETKFFTSYEAEMVNFATSENLYLLKTTYKNIFGRTLPSNINYELVIRNEKGEK